MEGCYFSEWIPRYIQYLRIRNYSSKTLISYEQSLKKFGHYIWLSRNGNTDNLKAPWRDGDTMRLEADVHIESREISEYMAFLTAFHSYQSSTMNRILSTLSSFYRYLTIQNVIPANPVPGIDRPKVKNQEIRYLKHNQVIRLLSTIDDMRDRLIFRTIYATGVRVSELCSMNVEDIDFEEQTIRVLGKGGKIRVVFIDLETLSELEKFIGNRIFGPVFIGQQNHHISPRTVQHIFKQYAPAGITPHKIRHSYASELYKRSKNLRVVQDNLGHVSIRTTEVYLHTDLDERRQVYRDHFPLGK